MGNEFYGLLREYLVAVRERDIICEQAKSKIDTPDTEEARRKLDLLNKRCRLLRREIRKFPGVDLSAKAGSRK